MVFHRKNRDVTGVAEIRDVPSFFEADGRCQSPPYAKFDYVELTP